MAHNEERQEVPSRGNGWEVVSLTSSAYAAAPGPELVDDSTAHRFEKDEAMFMSSHFVFPPSQHENLPLEPEKVEVQNLHESEETFSRLGLEAPDEFDEGTALQGNDFIEKERSLNSDSKYALYKETNKGGSNTYNDNTFISGQMESSEGLFNPEMLNSSNNVEEGDEYDISKLPCEAWWKSGATSLYTQAKEANAFWSIFVAAAVVGLVVLGRRLHRENFDVLRRLSLDSEKMKKSLAPISRFKAFGSHSSSLGQ